MFKKITLKRCGYFFICTIIFSQILYYFEKSSNRVNCGGYDSILNPEPLECGYYFIGNELIYFLVAFISMTLLAFVTIIIHSQSQTK